MDYVRLNYTLGILSDLSKIRVNLNKDPDNDEMRFKYFPSLP